MTALAYLMLDGSGEPQRQLQLCVYGPTVTVLLSWALVRWKRWLVVPSLLIASISATIVVTEATHPITRGAMLEDYGVSYVCAIYLSALFPFLAIASFYLGPRVRPPV